MTNKVFKELRDWTVLAVVAGGLYFTGYHTEVIGQIQRVLIMTGLLQPDLDIPEADYQLADFDLQFVDSSGRTLQLADYQGKTIFLNFWATWCPPCIAEMPDINNLYNQVGSDVVFLLISVDKEEEKVWAFEERKSFDYPLYRLSGGLPAAYHSGAVPTTFVIDPTGKIVMRREGMAKYDTQKFKDFLNSLSRTK
ncbi:MAG: TlpA disulfide reductase family protein [Cyclobacteriaceae bacterium]